MNSHFPLLWPKIFRSCFLISSESHFKLSRLLLCFLFIVLLWIMFMSFKIKVAVYFMLAGWWKCHWNPFYPHLAGNSWVGLCGTVSETFQNSQTYIHTQFTQWLARWAEVRKKPGFKLLPLCLKIGVIIPVFKQYSDQFHPLSLFTQPVSQGIENYCTFDFWLSGITFHKNLFRVTLCWSLGWIQTQNNLVLKQCKTVLMGCVV